MAAEIPRGSIFEPEKLDQRELPVRFGLSVITIEQNILIDLQRFTLVSKAGSRLKLHQRKVSLHCNE